MLFVFWAVGDYATIRGGQIARQIAGNLAQLPDATVYSHDPLALDAPGINEILIAGSSGFRYRYDGLRLVIRADDKYFLIPAGWSQAERRTIVLTDDGSLRFEFTARL